MRTRAGSKWNVGLGLGLGLGLGATGGATVGVVYGVGAACVVVGAVYGAGGVYGVVVAGAGVVAGVVGVVVGVVGVVVVGVVVVGVVVGRLCSVFAVEGPSAARTLPLAVADTASVSVIAQGNATSATLQARFQRRREVIRLMCV